MSREIAEADRDVGLTRDTTGTAPDARSLERPVPPLTEDVQPGRGVVRVERAAARSVATRVFARSPLRLLTPRNHGHAAWVYTSTFGGGLVHGDRITLEIEVGEGAAAFVSSQASTKVYRSDRCSVTEVDARVQRDGLLVLAPDPVACFRGSRYRQIQRIDLAAGAALVLIDSFTSGRRAFGERWAFDEYDTRLIVRSSGRLVLHDALALKTDDGPIASRLDRFEIIATAALIGAPLHAQAADLIMTVNAAPLERRPGLLCQASALRDGCLLRVAGTSVEQVGHAVRDLLSCVPGLLGDDPWTYRW